MKTLSKLFLIFLVIGSALLSAPKLCAVCDDLPPTKKPGEGKPISPTPTPTPTPSPGK